MASSILSAQIAPKELTRSNGLNNSAVRTEKPIRLGAKPNSPQAIILLNGKEVAYSTMNFISPNNIESMSVFKGEQAEKRLGKPAPNGLIEIKTKNSLSFCLMKIW